MGLELQYDICMHRSDVNQVTGIGLSVFNLQIGLQVSWPGDMVHMHDVYPAVSTIAAG